jgi:hypothetical protein
MGFDTEDFQRIAMLAVNAALNARPDLPHCALRHRFSDQGEQ